MPLLANHIAVVTGGGSGIGRAIANGYAREGARIVILDMNEKAAADVAKEIRDAGGKAESFALDVINATTALRWPRPSPTRSGKSRSSSTMPASPAATAYSARPRP